MTVDSGQKKGSGFFLLRAKDQYPISNKAKDECPISNTEYPMMKGRK